MTATTAPPIARPVRMRDDVPVDVVSAGIAGSTLGVITAWVMRDPLPKVETAARWLESVLLTPARMLTEE